MPRAWNEARAVRRSVAGLVASVVLSVPACTASPTPTPPTADERPAPAPSASTVPSRRERGFANCAPRLGHAPRGDMVMWSSFEEGKSLMDRGQFAAACGLFAGSYELEPSVGAALQMSECLEQMGQVDDACVALTWARDVARMRRDDREGHIADRFARLGCEARIEAIRAAEQ